mmetsp:Transcript_2213/g.5121  ORF Transcript_2213/g.5121 Transcript_2213/m.5121 type:complete len:342 (+) Transcript_2213:78-1103(+)
MRGNIKLPGLLYQRPASHPRSRHLLLQLLSPDPDLLLALQPRPSFVALARSLQPANSLSRADVRRSSRALLLAHLSPVSCVASAFPFPRARAKAGAKHPFLVQARTGGVASLTSPAWLTLAAVPVPPRLASAMARAILVLPARTVFLVPPRARGGAFLGVLQKPSRLTSLSRKSLLTQALPVLQANASIVAIPSSRTLDLTILANKSVLAFASFAAVKTKSLARAFNGLARSDTISLLGLYGRQTLRGGGERRGRACCRRNELSLTRQDRSSGRGQRGQWRWVGVLPACLLRALHTLSRREDRGGEDLRRSRHSIPRSLLHSSRGGSVPSCTCLQHIRSPC